MSKDGKQSGSGQQSVAVDIKGMPYAPTRVGVEADCFEVLCRTLKATMLTMAERADKEGIPKDVKEAYVEALTVMKTGEWLRLGLNTDKKMTEKLTLRRFDAASSFQPMKTRILEDHMRTQWTMISQGGLVSQNNGGTMTRVVLETIRDNPTVIYGQRVRKVTEEMLLGELQVEMGALQRQARVINKLCEEACNLDYLMNKTQCFDLHRWEAIAQ